MLRERGAVVGSSDDAENSAHAQFIDLLLVRN